MSASMRVAFPFLGDGPAGLHLVHDHVVALFLRRGDDRLEAVLLEPVIRIERVDGLRGVADDDEDFVHLATYSFVLRRRGDFLGLEQAEADVAHAPLVHQEATPSGWLASTSNRVLNLWPSRGTSTICSLSTQASTRASLTRMRIVCQRFFLKSKNSRRDVVAGVVVIDVRQADDRAAPAADDQRAIAFADGKRRGGEESFPSSRMPSREISKFVRGGLPCHVTPVTPSPSPSTIMPSTTLTSPSPPNLGAFQPSSVLPSKRIFQA